MSAIYAMQRIGVVSRLAETCAQRHGLRLLNMENCDREKCIGENIEECYLFAKKVERRGYACSH